MTQDGVAERLHNALMQLEELWLKYDFYLAETVAPGIDAATIRQAVATLGLAPPPEMVSWWEWHNGVGEPQGVNGHFLHRLSGIGAWALISLDEAIRLAATEREVARDVAAKERSMTAQDFWRDEWLPILGGSSDKLVMRCTEPHLGAITLKERDGPAERDRIDAPSLADLVEQACRDIVNGTHPENIQRAWRRRPSGH